MHRGQKQGNLSHELAGKLLRSCLIAREKRMHAVGKVKVQDLMRQFLGRLLEIATQLRPCKATGYNSFLLQ
jgi:hypothetical protein